MQIEKPFDCHFESYQKFRPKYPEHIFTHIVSHCQRRLLAWDCGTGNGQAALGLTPFFDTVYATDSSSEQISRAFHHEKIMYHVEPAERCGLQASSVDLVCVAEALHWFRHTDFFDEVRRVATDGAVFASWTYGACCVSPPVDSLVALLKREILGPYWASRAVIDENEVQSLPWKFESTALTMTEFLSFDQFIGYIDSWSAVKAYSVSQLKHPTDLVVDDLRSAWGPDIRRRVTWPIELQVSFIE
jgi:Methyltransferase domain